MTAKILQLFALSLACLLSFQLTRAQEDKEIRPAFEVEMTITAANFPENYQPQWIEKVAVDSKGNIYVLDNRRAQVFKLSPEGKFLLAFGGYGDAPGKFIRPDDILITSKDVLIIPDGPLRRVNKFTSEGTHTGSFSTSALRGPTFKIIGSLGPNDELILCAAKDRATFHVYDSTGNYLRSFGKLLIPPFAPKDIGLGELYVPSTVVYSKGFVYATDPFKYEILKYDFKSGKLVSTYMLRFLQWRDAEFKPGGVQSYTGSASTVVLDDSRILNILSRCEIEIPCQYFFDLIDKNGKTVTGPQLVNYSDIILGLNGRLYLSSKWPPLRIERCKFVR